MNYVCMILYFIAAGCLVGFAYTTNNMLLYAGIAFLAIAIILSKVIKKGAR